MLELFSIAASLKATCIGASFAFARGDMLAVIAISTLFGLAQFGAKPIGQKVPLHIAVISLDQDRSR